MAEQTLTDPFAVWRNWLAESERQWNALLNEAMATDQYAKSMGQFMDMYLNFQKSMSESMGRYLTTLNVPTRQDVLSLGDRLSAIEDRLIAMEAKIIAGSPAVAVQNGAGPASGLKDTPRPARTRKPPAQG